MNWEKIKYNSDKETIGNTWDKKSIKFHYNFLESSILKHIPEANNVLDVGSGFGHWINFYQDVFNSNVESIEPNQNEYNVIKHHCYLKDFKPVKKYDVINAIGVFHHIMVDLQQSINICYDSLESGGYLIIGTRFDFLKENKESFRIFRTIYEWNELLKDFQIIALDRSNPPIHIRKHLDLIICKKP